MIKLLEDLLIEATTNPNVPGSLVAGLRNAVERARSVADGTKWPEPPPEPATMRVAYCTPYRVCVKAHETNFGNTVPVGHVVTLEVGELLQQPDCWLPCDKDGWVSATIPCPVGMKVEAHDPYGLQHLPGQWRPARAPQVSAIDEMAEQMKRWAAPTRSRDPDHELPTRECAAPFRYETTTASGGVPSPVIDPVIAWFDKDGKIRGRVSDEQLDALCEQALADLEARNGWEAQRKAQEAEWFESVKAAPALAVQEGGSHYKDMKIQPVEYIHANGLGYFEGNVVKYASRWRAKGGLQDLKKARHYLDLLIELEGGVK